ncbi:MAG: outer membrane protein assembly factor BamD [Sulfurovum sp.]
MNLSKTILMGMVVALLLVGCTKDDEVAEFNKPAIYWYKQIAKSIAKESLDKADAYYISLKSEHIRSPLIPTAMMMLAHAHINAEEYLLANYYLDEYNKRFGSANTMEYIDFMKLKASFLGVRDAYKDQRLIMTSISKATHYLDRYPDSAYAPLVNTIYIRLQMSQYLLNENIASLYDRTGKKDASKIYRAKNSNSVVKLKDITPPKKGIIGKIFD